ncbi:MAG TPA: hypothetical protein DCW68_04125 [Rhodospirillaceae bacterium]|nr:MAG: hypothetical protein A2018_07310 [Alphaproteobacteria bacterium GWF2_58_20]HAU29283.1 hypothetical protein [Rhodospirillaceae bacterium]
MDQKAKILLLVMAAAILAAMALGFSLMRAAETLSPYPDLPPTSPAEMAAPPAQPTAPQDPGLEP